jgi:hypothetical protein
MAGLEEPEGDLLRVSQYMETCLGKAELYLRLRQVFEREPTPTAIHDFLASLPGRLRAARLANPALRCNPNLLIVTTNYDDALERAFTLEKEPFDVVTYIARGDRAGSFQHLAAGNDEPQTILRPNEYAAVSPATRSVILKLHGAVDRAESSRDSFVITEDNYIDYLANSDAAGILPVTLAAKLKSSHLLFLGYGLKDWNLRVILRRLWGTQTLDFISWAVQRGPDEIEELFWRDRGVEIHDADLGVYIDQLSRQLGTYLRENRPSDDDMAVAS